MKLPKSVRVAHMNFAIEEWTSPSATANHKWGEFSVGEQMIRVQVEDRQFWEVVCTLVHEIMHAICWAYEIRLPSDKQGDSEERMVCTMSVAWAQVYRDNPELIGFIASGDARETMEEYATRRVRENRE